MARTIKEIFKNLTAEEKEMVYYLVGSAIQDSMRVKKQAHATRCICTGECGR